MNIGHWQYIREFDPSEWIGFAYSILNKLNGKSYFGKKFFQATTHRRLVGKKNRKKIVKESNWRTYTGSCKNLNADIEKYGEENFEFVILGLYESRSSLAYAECRNILLSDSLLYPDRFYNGRLEPLRFTVKPPSAREIEWNI
jgi:hypothetical protein